MALLQISEPGMSTAPHQHRLAIGIDLGTTNSLVAAVRNGVADVISDGQGRALLPSVVRYDENGSIKVGAAAQAKQSNDSVNTIVSVKRFMGRGVADVVDADKLPYRFIDAPGMLQIETRAGIKSPVEISAEILKVLRRRAEAALGGELVGAVITVPAYFDDAQRQATKDAARLAGLNVLRLLNEPTAAAVAYGLDNASEGVFAVFDLGGGTFDISILRLQRGVFEVLATNGDSALGGDDFDAAIANWVEQQIGVAKVSAGERRMILTRSRAAKEALTNAASIDLNLPLHGQDRKLTLTRETFNELTAELVARTLAPTKKALRDAKLSPGDIDGVVMVGGATRMPHIQAAVKNFFRREPLNNLDPDQVVAIGAAIQADTLAGNRSENDLLLLDVIPLSLGIETMGGLVEKIIPRNSTIPIARAQEFTTYKDGQTAMSIHVLQGERELAADCRSLAKFELRGFPPMVAGAARIRVTYQVDADGLLSVAAREQSGGVEASITVKPSYGLTDAEITAMLEASHRDAKSDMQARALREAEVDAQRMLAAVAAALEADGTALLDAHERNAIEQAIATLRASIPSGHTKQIKQATEALAEATETFAARRMNRSVQQALTGHSIEEL